jgi:hypothetical protein
MEATPLMQSGKMRILAVGSPKRLSTSAGRAGRRRGGARLRQRHLVRRVRAQGHQRRDRRQAAHGDRAGGEPPEYQKYMAEHNSEGRTSTPEELTDIIKQDMQHWGGVVRKANIPM